VRITDNQAREWMRKLAGYLCRWRGDAEFDDLKGAAYLQMATAVLSLPEGHPNPTGVAMRAGWHGAISYLRRRRPAVSLDALWEVGWQPVQPDGTPAVEARVVWEWLRERLQERQRQVIELVYLEELTVEEAGRRMGYAPRSSGVHEFRNRALAECRYLLGLAERPGDRRKKPQLDEQDRFIVLAFAAGKTDAEIGRQVGLTKQAVNARRRRAQAILKKRKRDGLSVRLGSAATGAHPAQQ
jgi:DNA-directed RNA polymerase specialized sigma24 family protein